MNTQRTIIHKSFLLTVAVVLLLSSHAALAAAGKVVFARGDVQVERDGKLQPLAKGAEIESGDTIITGSNGRVQLLMADGDRMALRTRTRFKVDEFKKPDSPDKPETGRGFYSLVKGGFRAVTRSLGKRGLDSYRVKTSVATIGIRGTSYTVVEYAGDDVNPPGVYWVVNDGSLTVGNNTGSMNFGPGQYGYAADMNSPITLLPGPPSFLGPPGGPPGGGNNNDDEDGGYSDGSSPHGCADAMSGDINCPPIQPYQGDGFDFTPGAPPPVEEDHHEEFFDETAF